MSEGSDEPVRLGISKRENMSTWPPQHLVAVALLSRRFVSMKNEYTFKNVLVMAVFFNQKL